MAKRQGDVDLRFAQVSAPQLTLLAWLGWSWLGSARLGLAWLGSARLGSARLGSARLGSVRLDLAWLGFFLYVFSMHSDILSDTEVPMKSVLVSLCDIY